MQIKRNIALSDSGFVFDPSTGDSFSTNPIGLEIIKLLKDGKTNEEIKATVVKQYMTDDSTFEKDLYDFVNMLSKLKLSENDEKEKD
ncbi:MAG: PqqD family protein [Bacteroidia bacterium]